jgi:hypothetical protein
VSLTSLGRCDGFIGQIQLLSHMPLCQVLHSIPSSTPAIWILSPRVRCVACECSAQFVLAKPSAKGSAADLFPDQLPFMVWHWNCFHGAPTPCALHTTQHTASIFRLRNSPLRLCGRSMRHVTVAALRHLSGLQTGMHNRVCCIPASKILDRGSGAAAAEDRASIFAQMFFLGFVI